MANNSLPRPFSVGLHLVPAAAPPVMWRSQTVQLGQGPGWRASASVLLSLAGGMSCSCDCENRCCWCETETVRYHRCPTVSLLGEGKRCVGEHAPLGWHISAVPSRRLEWEAARPWASRAGSRRCDCVMRGDQEAWTDSGGELTQTTRSVKA